MGTLANRRERTPFPVTAAALQVQPVAALIKEAEKLLVVKSLNLSILVMNLHVFKNTQMFILGFPLQ